MAKYITQYGKYTGIPPNSTIIIEHADGVPPKDLKVPSDVDWNVGDIIAFSEYRDTNTYLVDSTKKLVPNPDYSGSGYLTIPLEISRLFPNAYEHYKNHITDQDTPSVALELLHNDGWIISTYGRAFPSEWKEIILWYSWGEFERLWIDFGNGRNHDFEKEDTIDKILAYFVGCLEKQASLLVQYKVSGETYKKVKYYNETYKLQLPPTWTRKISSWGCGYNAESANIVFFGSVSDLVPALANINKYFQLHGAKITGPVVGDKPLISKYSFDQYIKNLPK